jgi:hypothetical protein
MIDYIIEKTIFKNNVRLYNIVKPYLADKEFAINVISKINYDITEEKLYELIRGYNHGLSTEEINIYNKPSYTAELMREIRICLMKGYNIPSKLPTQAKRWDGL